MTAARVLFLQRSLPFSPIMSSLCSNFNLLMASLVSTREIPSLHLPSFGVFQCAPSASLPMLLCRISKHSWTLDFMHNTALIKDNPGATTPFHIPLTTSIVHEA
ncbi:unnamed protein product [Ixodes pacificus]